MEQILFKNYSGARLALNIVYWMRDGGRKTLGGLSTGGKPAALRAILDKYIRAGFMVQAAGWLEFRSLIAKAAKVDGKGSQAAEKLAIINEYKPDGDAEPGYIYLKKDKKQEVKTMKKVTMIWKKNSKEQPEIQATLDTETGAAYFKDPESGLYVALDYASGLKIAGEKTRKAAAAFVAEHAAQIENVRKGEKYAAAIINGKTEEKQPEPAKEVKAEPVKVQEETPEEVKKSVMDEVKAGDFSAILQMLGTNRSNTAAIIRAGILEKVFTVPEMVTFLETGRAPAYHTFDVWKKAGFTVRKGEKAAFKAAIWKYTADGKTDAEPETETETDTDEVKAGPDFIHKVSYFFGPSQVEKLEVKKDLDTVPDGCKMEVVKGVKWISGNTKEHKETLKAAGYRWSNKRGAWYRF